MSKIRRPQISAILPGFAAAFAIALAAGFLSGHYGAPVMLFALLLGMAFNFAGTSKRFGAGVGFASTEILRIGVALLGVRITIGDMFALGPSPLVLAVGGILTTMALGMIVSCLLGKKFAFGALTGGAVGICGASAALALSAILPREERGLTERDTIFTVVAVTALSTVAMIAYPILVRALGLSDIWSGIFIGATVHDVAQVVGAGFSISDQAGDAATAVKLLRVAMLVPVVALIAIVLTRRTIAGEKKSPVRFPLFLISFVILVLANSAGLLPPVVTNILSELSRWALITAIAALGMKTSLKDLFDVGPTAFVVVVVETIWIAGFALAVIWMFGGWG